MAAPPDNCMRLWDKAQMEPYSSRKNVTYYVLCPQNPTMSAAAASFFSDLSCVYEVLCLCALLHTLVNTYIIGKSPWQACGAESLP